MSAHPYRPVALAVLPQPARVEAAACQWCRWSAGGAPECYHPVAGWSCGRPCGRANERGECPHFSPSWLTTERTKTLTNGTKVIVTRGRGLNPNAPRLTHWTVRAEDGTWIADGATMREALSNANALVGAEVSVMVSGEIRDGKGHHPSATFLGGNHCRMADEIRRARA